MRALRLAPALLLALALAAPAVHAHEAGDILIRAGAITVNPKADSSSVKSTMQQPMLEDIG